jgi:hypothetical protein
MGHNLGNLYKGNLGRQAAAMERIPAAAAMDWSIDLESSRGASAPAT